MKHRLLAFTIVLLVSVACGQDASKKRAVSNVGPQSESVSLDQMLGFWSVTSIDGVPTVRAEGLDHDKQVGLQFGPPCYEVGDKHCNLAIEGWDPAIPHAGRFSVRGFSGCNHFGGEGRLIEEISEFKPVLATQIGCPTITRQESWLFKILSSKARITLEGSGLLVRSLNGGELKLQRRASKN